MGFTPSIPPSATIANAQYVVASALQQSRGVTGETASAKAQAASQDFEAVFLNTMFNQMFTGIDGEGPFGGGAAAGVWRSMLTDEYSKSFAKSGGLGIADHVYKSLLEIQEARGR